MFEALSDYCFFLGYYCNQDLELFLSIIGWLLNKPSICGLVPGPDCAQSLLWVFVLELALFILCLSACMSMYPMHEVPMKTRRRYQSPRNWSYRWDGWEPSCGSWELNVGPLKEQPGLLTTKSSSFWVLSASPFPLEGTVSPREMLKSRHHQGFLPSKGRILLCLFPLPLAPDWVCGCINFSLSVFLSAYGFSSSGICSVCLL